MQKKGIDLFASRKNEIECFRRDETFVNFINNLGEDFTKVASFLSKEWNRILAKCLFIKII
ncbi:MAG: hypothetical protein ACJAZY_003831 [Spirosomataceae bacterium]